MLSLELLFEDTRKGSRDLGVGEIQEMISGKNINIDVKMLPIVNPPKEGSSDHFEEMEIVKNAILNPMLSGKFLELSDKKPEKLFKRYAKENNLDINLKQIEHLCNQLESIVLYLKNQYDRNRPKKSFEVYNIIFPHNGIKDNKSSSYPSGHTAMSYFIANLIAEKYPGHRPDLETLAEMIGQSRIDNGVHYPSDISFGRYLGELAASSLRGKKLTKDKKTVKDVNDIFKEKWKKDPNYLYALSEFVRRSNEIESYPVDSQNCLESCENFLRGFPVDYCTDNKYIRSHLNSLRAIASLKKIDNIYNIVEVHKALGDDVIEREHKAGSLRNFKHMSKAGVPYPPPDQIIVNLNHFLNFEETPFKRHAFYEWVHPFCDGNGRSGRVLMAHDMDFDFSKVLELIGPEYIPNVVKLTNEINRMMKS